MKLSIVQCYQAIRVNGETLTRINSSPATGDQPAGEKHGKYDLELQEGVGVIIRSSGEHVIVPLNNVAYATIAKKQEAQVKEKK